MKKFYVDIEATVTIEVADHRSAEVVAEVLVGNITGGSGLSSDSHFTIREADKED